MEKVTVFKVIHQTINHCTGEKTSFVYNMFRKLISMKKRGKVYETHDEEWVILSKEKKDIFTIIETKE